MCTIALALQAHPDHPLLVSAVRDEFYARPARGPVPIPRASAALGGVDGEKGGSWTGVTAGGLYVGLTNQRPTGPVPEGLRSRGEVVVEALAAGSVYGAREVIEALDPRDFPSFNLLVAGAAQAFVAHVRREPARKELLYLRPGVHVLGNDRLGSPAMPKTQRAAERLRALLTLRGEPLLQALERVLADHEQPDDVPPPPEGAPYDHAFARRLQALCVHTEIYGSRSALVAAIGAGGVQALRWSDGPPCVTPFVDARSLLPVSEALRN